MSAAHPIHNPREDFLQSKATKWLLFLNLVVALIYFVSITFLLKPGNPVLFALLVAGQLFYLLQAVGYAHAVWKTDWEPPRLTPAQPPVDVFITVTDEPLGVVEETARAALAMDYPELEVHILNDGKVAGADEWEATEKLAKRLGINVITRTEPGGAKAGNINHGLSLTKRPFFVIFDADHVPHADFLTKMMPRFYDERVAFVQSPQFYKNHAENGVTGTAWEQQELFFGALCKGKNRLNATFMCGTNMVVRRSAIMEVGGMCETNIAEDFLTSLFIHEKGWRSVYVPEVLAEGLAPKDLLSYSKQQLRWARGSLEVVFKYNPLLRRGLSLSQKIQYIASASFFLSGSVILMNAMLPLVFFFTGLVPLQISTMILAAIFLPYIFLTLYTLQVSSNFSYTFRALAFSLASFPIQLKALWAVLTRQKTTFAVTSKKGVSGSFANLVAPHLIYFGLVLLGLLVALIREGLNASVIANISWASLYIASFLPFILTANLRGLKGQSSEPVLPAETSLIARRK